MRLIKRYPNRKLYDTEARQYISLEGVAELVRQGQDVRVTDHASGEDLTAQTLAQIISGQEKKQRGGMPHALLASLIQSGSQRLDAIQRTILSSLGAGRLVDDEIHQRIQTLIRRGELSESEAEILLDKLLDPRLKNEPLVLEEELQEILEERQVATRQDVQKLLDLLDELSARIDAQMNVEGLKVG